MGRSIGVSLLLFAFASGYCQDATNLAATTESVETKLTRHYVGVQANQLISQLLNFGGTAASPVNPYFMVYSFNSTKTGVGMNFGLGYTYTSSSNGDPITPRTTTDNTFSFRIGVEKKVYFHRKWFYSYGMDVLYEDANSKTETVFNPGGGGINNTTETSTSGGGLGPRFTLNFHISDKLLLGTEASYYYKFATATTKVTGQPDQTNKPKSFSFAVPAVIFLVLKF
jgi:hypothetical protein